MNGHINETTPPLVPIGEVKLVQVQIVVWFVRTCEVWILFVLHFFTLKLRASNIVLCSLQCRDGREERERSQKNLNYKITCSITDLYYEACPCTAVLIQFTAVCICLVYMQ